MKRPIWLFLFLPLFWQITFSANDQNPCTEEKAGCEVTEAPELKVTGSFGEKVAPGSTVTATFFYYITPGSKITKDGNCETEEDPEAIYGTLSTPVSQTVTEVVPCNPGGEVTLKSPAASGFYSGCDGSVDLSISEGADTAIYTIKEFEEDVDERSEKIEIARSSCGLSDGNGNVYDVVTYGYYIVKQRVRVQTCPTEDRIAIGEPEYAEDPYETVVEVEDPASDCPVYTPPYVFALSFQDSGGPRHRKIALNGAPLSDEKPQAKEETDQPDEETYIDALNLSLHHDTTDVYIPLPATDLFLGVRRNVISETWEPYCDLRPSEFLGKPFGANWTSNLSASIRFNDEDGFRYAYVTDDTGREYRFAIIYLWTSKNNAGVLEYGASYSTPEDIGDLSVRNVYVPLPSTNDDQQTILCSLVDLGDNTFRFQRKYGSTLIYKKATSNKVPYGRCEALKTYTYARLLSVEDRYGNFLDYTYIDSTDLIPSKIQFRQSNGAGPSLTITTNDKGYVSSVKDPRGKTTSYSYTTFNYQNPFESATYPHHQLVSVTAADGGASNYTYAFYGDLDAHTPGDLGKARLQLELSSISDPLGQTYAFEHTQNHTNTYWHSQDGYIVSTGQPLLVSKVTLPNGSSATFETEATRTFDWADLGGITVSASRTTTVTDAMGNERVYEFSEPTCESIRNWISDPDFEAPRLVYFHKTTIRTAFGEETYKFDPAAGMALTEATDLSGNKTSFAYSEPFSYGLGEPYGLGRAATMSGYYGDPSSQTNALGGQKTFTYGTHRIMTSLTDELGVKTLYEVDAKGRRLKEQIFPSGSSTPLQETVFSYDSSAFPAFVTKKTIRKLSDGASWTTDLITEYQPDASGRIAQEIVDPSGLALTTSHTYDANGNKLTSTDPRGNTTAFEYDDRNRLAKVTYPGAVTKTYAYDLRGNKLSETDENGVLTQYQYDSLNRLTTQTLVMGGGSPNLVRTFAYNHLNSRVSETDPEGHATTFAYDALQRLTQKTDALGGPTAYAYGTNSGGTVFDTSGWKPTSVTDPRGYLTLVTYDTLYRPVSEQVEYQAGVFAITAKTYDAVGNLLTLTDPLGMVTATTYDALRRPLTITEAANDSTVAATTTKSYTSTGLEYRVVDPLGGETLTEYDAAARPVKVTGPSVTGGRPVTQTAYDAAGNVASVTDPLGNTANYTYDARNRRIQEMLPSVADASGGGSASRPTRLMTYDDVGNVIAVQDARGAITTTAYDSARRPVQVVAPAVPLAGGGSVSPTTTTTYDRNGNILTVTDPNGHTTTNTYDALNRLLTTTDAAGILVANEYDAVGNRTAVIDGKNQRTEFGYDGLNRNTTTKDPAGLVTTLAYDAVNKTGRTDAAGRATQYTYDARHRLISVSYTGRSDDNRAYTYDKMGRILTVTEPGKSGAADVAHTYDALGRILSEKSNGLTHLYTHDLAGNRTKVIYGGTGTILDSGYDALNRLSTLSENGRLTTYGYDLNGNRAKLTLPNGETITTQFDALNRQAAITTTRSNNTVVASLTQAYDAAGNLCVLTESVPGTGLASRTVTNAYDNANRLTTETVAESTGKTTITTYSYDSTHNRLGRSVDVTEGGMTTTTSTTYAYNALNQVLTATTGSEATTYTYDLAGNRIGKSDGTNADTLAWDYENRLVSFTKEIGDGAGSYTFVYDYRTRRVQAAAPGIAGGFTRFVFSGGTSVQERDATVPSGALIVENIRGSDWGGGVGGLLYSLRNEIPSYNHYNSRGDVIAKTDGSSVVTFAAQYEAFGDIKEQVGSNPDRQRSNTKDWDIPGYVNEGFRFRDLETGSFLSRDPLGFVDGPNMYSYVVQNPWSKFDPLGLEKDKNGVKVTREGHHVNPVDNWKDNKELSPEVRQQLDNHRIKPAPGGESARHTWSKAHDLYNETTAKIQADFIKEARKAGIDPAKLSGDEAKKFANDLVKKMMKNEYVSGFNSIVRSGKGTAENLNKLRGAFLSSGKKSGWLGKLRVGKKIPGISAVVGATLFVVDAKSEGIGQASENFVKGVTYYDIAEGAGNLYGKKSDDIRYNVEHGSFDEDKSGSVGRYYNDLNEVMQSTPGISQ